MIRRIPIPVCGVMLGVAALGNMLQSYSEALKMVCGAAAAFLLVLILLKSIRYPEMIREDMNSPVLAGVAGTFPMALMILSTYVKPFMWQTAYYIWLFAIALHLVLIIYFTIRFVLHCVFKNVFTSWFVVYVGIGSAGVTAAAFERTGIGTASFWFALITFFPLLVIITARYLKYPVPDPLKPLAGIYAAPMSLCIVAYIQSVQIKSYTALMVMWAAASILYVYALVSSFGLLKTFYPSFAGFTFPFVISATATRQLMVCATNMGHPLPWMNIIAVVQTMIAVLMVVYVYARYMAFLFVRR